MKSLSILSAAALLAGGLAMANAQTTPGTSSGASPGTAATQEKCWDAAANMVRDRSPGAGAGATVGSGVGATGQPGAGAGADAKIGATGTGADAKAGTGVGATADVTGKRPPEAMGLPNC